MKSNKDYTYILRENPPQALLNDSLLAKKIISRELSVWTCNEMRFLNNILPHLQSMKMKTNRDTNSYYFYLQFSTAVAQISICMIRKKLQNPFFSAEVDIWKTAWNIVNAVGELDMDKEFREGQYEVFRKLLKKECRRMGILPSFLNYGVITRIGIILVSAIIWYTMSGLGKSDSLPIGILNGCLMAGGHYIYTKK